MIDLPPKTYRTSNRTNKAVHQNSSANVVKAIYPQTVIREMTHTAESSLTNKLRQWELTFTNKPLSLI